MGNENYSRLQSIICRFPYLHRFLDDGFIRKQCKGELKSRLLRGLSGLVNGRTINEFKQHLPTLESRLTKIATIKGYDRLQKSLKSASWSQYYETITQIDTSVRFAERNLVKEIEPELPLTYRAGFADVLLSFSQQCIYCECASLPFSPQSQMI